MLSAAFVILVFVARCASAELVVCTSPSASSPVILLNAGALCASGCSPCGMHARGWLVPRWRLRLVRHVLVISGSGLRQALWGSWCFVGLQMGATVALFHPPLMIVNRGRWLVLRSGGFVYLWCAFRCGQKKHRSNAELSREQGSSMIW